MNHYFVFTSNLCREWRGPFACMFHLSTHKFIYQRFCLDVEWFGLKPPISIGFDFDIEEVKFGTVLNRNSKFQRNQNRMIRLWNQRPLSKINFPSSKMANSLQLINKFFMSKILRSNFIESSARICSSNNVSQTKMIKCLQ